MASGPYSGLACSFHLLVGGFGLAFLVEQLRRHGELPRPPGERLHYSNLGYAVLGEVLASAGGADFRGGSGGEGVKGEGD